MRLILCLALLAAQACLAQVVATFDRSAVPGAQMALNASTHRLYVAGGTVVTVIDGATNSAVQVPIGHNAQYVAVNSATNRIYTGNPDDGTVSVIDGATHAVVSLPIGGAGPIAINERTNKIYVIRSGNNGDVTVIDGASNNWYSIVTGSQSPRNLVANPDTNRLYVAYFGTGDVRAIDAASPSDHPPSVSIAVPGHPAFIAVNRATNKIYASTSDPAVALLEIDGATNAATPIAGYGYAPIDMVLNSVTNRVYLSLQDRIAVIDARTRAVSYIPTGSVSRLAVDAVHDRVYAAGGNRIFVIDGATQNFSQIAVPTQTNLASSVTVDPATSRLYSGGIGVAVFDAAAIPTPPPNYGINLQGMWWAYPAGSESGWGFNIAHQGHTVFATLFTYDTDGSPLWLVMPNARRRSEMTWTGEVYRTTGPAITAATFDPAAVRATVVGDLTISLFENNTNAGVLIGTINGNTFDKNITREVYAAPVPTCTAGGTPGPQPNYQDMWWAAPAGRESGWGVNLAHQGDTIFAALFLYDEGGKPMWLVASNVSRTGNANYSGALYRTAGGTAYTSRFSYQAPVSVMPVGSLSLAFSDANNGVLTYSYGGVTRTKAITRQAFASPATVCR